MKEDNGTLSFGTAIDWSGFDEGAEHISEKLNEITSKAETDSARINELLNNIPVVNIDVVSNAAQTLEGIQQGFDELDYVFDANKAAIVELEAEYARLEAAAKKAQKSNNKDEVAKLKQQTNAIKENIAIRKKVIEEAAKTADTLASIEDSLKKEAAEIKKSEAPHVSFRQRIRELKEELVAMEAAGERNTEKYRQIQAEVGRLTDAWKDATNQANRLAHDQAGMQGIISGLSGLSGGLMAASSAVSLFTGENEDLQKAMLKVQQLMSITMGLQQLQAALDKDSAFRLVTLTGLKEWWAKLLAVGRGEMIADTAATAANAAAETANAVATEADAAAKEHEAVAAGKAAGMTAVDTTSKIANTGAAVAGRAANIGLAGAFRMVGAAIKSIPVFGWIAAAIGAIISVVSLFTDESEMAKEKVESLNKVTEDGAKAYAKAKGEIEGYITKLNTFRGSKEQEKEVVKELNSKYGEALGHYDSLAQWQDVLKQKGEGYCLALLKEAEAQALLSKYTEAYVALIQTRNTDAREFGSFLTSSETDKKRKQQAISNAEKEADYWLTAYKNKMKEAENFEMHFDIGGHVDPKKAQADAERAALAIKDAVTSYKNAVKKYIKEANNEINQLTLDAQEEGLEKDLMASRLGTQKKLDALKEEMRELGRQRKAMLKAQYMNQEGATEYGWANSAAGKKTDAQYANEILAEGGKAAQLYYKQKSIIVENGEREIQNITQKYNDELIDQFGTKEEKIEKLTRKWYAIFAHLPAEYMPEAIRQWEAEEQAIEDEWINKYGSYRQKRLSLIQKYNREEEALYEDGSVTKDADGNITGGTLKKGVTQENVDELRRQRDEAVDSLDEEVASRSASYQQWMDKISTMTIKQMKALLDTAKVTLQQLEKDPNADPKKLAEARALVAKLSREIENANLSPDEECLEQWRMYSEHLDDVGKSLKSLGDEMGGVVGEAMSLLGTIATSTSDMIKNITDLAQHGMDAMEDGAKAASKAIMAAQSAVAILAIIQAIYTAVTQLRDFIDNNFDTDSGFGQFISDFLHYITDAETMLENLAWSLLGPMGTIIGMMNSTNKNSDRKKHLQEIERLLDSYEELSYQISQLEKQASNTFGETNSKIRQQQIELKNLQIEALNAAIAEEEQLKDPDEDKIAEWRNQIRTLQGDIEDLEAAAEDAIFGENIKSAIENFANALVDAWANGKSASEAANEYVRDMIKKTAMQAILDYTQASSKIDAIRQKIKAYLQNDGLIDADEQAEIEDMAQQLMDEVGEQFEWAKHLFEDGRNAGVRGIATASQESVDENNARLTTIQGHTYSLVMGMNDLNATGTQILARLTGIEHNTDTTNDKLDAMTLRMKRIDDTLDTMQRQGIIIKT